ncbi:MAG: 2,3-bisphosphoglycerate-independent phosphoglycerate mutase [Myxococcota bacterium]|nr:2,3-bisphosphoglycerate-independent phosphoglycerate mutase [Myxococcota bacterium]
MSDTITLTEAKHAGIEGPIVTVVMDGVGIGEQDAGDAVFHANTPNLDRYRLTTLTSQLSAHGVAVGMPSNSDMGNSEVGHNVLGCGRIFDQGAKLVANAIASGSLFEGEVWKSLVSRCIKHATPLHFIGLLSDGNVHSHIDHLIAMLRRADLEGVCTARVHVLLDGRDVEKISALRYVDQLEACLDEISSRPSRDYAIASGGGRMTTTMDRYDADWPMVERGWQVHVLGRGNMFPTTRAAIEAFRAEAPGIGDQDLPSFVIERDGKPIGAIEDGAAVIAFNFRGDRMLELCASFEQDDFEHFDRIRRPDVLFAGMMQYDGDSQTPRSFLVTPPAIDATLSELLCARGITQFACSETQKFGHVTYFWNGNRSGYFDERLESYLEIPSRTEPFDHFPEMRAAEITEATQKALTQGGFKYARINYANGDMVGHTGNFEATVRSVEAVDQQLAILERTILGMGGVMLVTADHGNADDMGERNKKTGELVLDSAGIMVPKTSHSLNPVPFHVVMPDAYAGMFALKQIEHATLANLAATTLTLLGLDVSQAYHPSLLKPA